jgi:hypothetical protein
VFASFTLKFSEGGVPCTSTELCLSSEAMAEVSMDIARKIRLIERQELVPALSRESHPVSDQAAQAAWDKLLLIFKDLDRSAIGHHLCLWADPNQFTFGSQAVVFDFPIRELQKDQSRGSLRFSRLTDGKTPPAPIWTFPLIDTDGRFAWKVWGAETTAELVQTESLAGLILQRLHAAETTL